MLHMLMLTHPTNATAITATYHVCAIEQLGKLMTASDAVGCLEGLDKSCRRVLPALQMLASQRRHTRMAIRREVATFVIFGERSCVLERRP